MKNYLLLLLGILIVLGLGFGGYSYYTLSKENTALKASLDQSAADLAAEQKQKDDLVSTLQKAADQNKSFATQLDQVTATANQLKWLSFLDPQLMQKYSKVYFLNENYTPKELSPIDSKFLFNVSRPLEIHDRVLPFLQKMLQQAVTDGVNILVDSAYRSFSTQATLKSSYRVTYGSGANSFSADQGYSEHQLGTALDFTTPTIGGGLTGFEKTAAYTWMKDNAYKFGFILSYPQNNKYYIYEPWHWRFVGIELATKLHTDNKNFYDLDQREINTYLGNMFNTSATQ